MATYSELLILASNEALFNKVRVACWVAADTVRAEPDTTPNHANRIKWAKSVFENPDKVAQDMVYAVLAQNKDATAASITGASDAQVQAAVDNAVDVFSG